MTLPTSSGECRSSIGRPSAHRSGGAAAEAAAAPAPTVAPLRPVVMTRTKLEAAVFGAGYSSLPTMSVEEFYEQRVRDGV